jgi:hypothetical protein
MIRPHMAPIYAPLHGDQHWPPAQDAQARTQASVPSIRRSDAVKKIFAVSEPARRRRIVLVPGALSPPSPAPGFDTKAPPLIAAGPFFVHFSTIVRATREIGRKSLQ